MSEKYNEYLREHISNVQRAWNILRDYLSIEFITYYHINFDIMKSRVVEHDVSKFSPLEYTQYDEYFYGEHNVITQRNFNKAWLHHQHLNPHHWQHWVLRNDDGTTIALDMDIYSVLEMICDWWSFSLKQNKPLEIINFYNNNKEHIMISDNTRCVVEEILEKIERKYKNENTND